MKILSVVAIAATIFSANAFAGDHSINAVGRTGWIYKDNDVKKTGISNSSSFNLDYLRTTLAGAVSPSVKYFLTVDLLGLTGNDTVDGTPTLIDEAFVTKTFSFGTSATLGKKAVLIGGREYDYLNYDRYTTSFFYQATPVNQVGLTFSQEIAGQTFMAQYFNGNKDNGKGTATNAQSKFGYAVGWNGNLLNSMIRPIVVYTVVPEAGGANGGLTSLSTTATPDHRANKGNDNFLSAGVQFNTPHNIILEVDYDLLTEKDAAGTISNKNDLKTTSLVTLIRYTAERFAPFVKFISDTRELGSTKTESRLAYDLGVEFKESKDDMIRYHIVYSGASVKTGLNTTEVKSSPSSILVGLMFDASILK
ncbi:MAG: porin [Bacteriovorax sp.]|nr:porin [Bacteriovorax sp.]